MEEKIEIRANKLNTVFGRDYHHLYIVYTDAKGRECFLRGGPSRAPAENQLGPRLSELSGGMAHVRSAETSKASTSGASRSGSNPSAALDKQQGGMFGHIQTEVMWLDKTPGVRKPIDYHPNQPYESIVVARGPQCRDKFEKLCKEMQNIDASKTRYSPAGPNSNSTVCCSLRNVGIEPKLPRTVWAPGAEMEIDTSRVRGPRTRGFSPSAEKQGGAAPTPEARLDQAKAKMREMYRAEHAPKPPGK